MVKVKDIIAEVEKIAPPELAEEWDNSGLQLGNPDRVVKKLLVAVDVTRCSATAWAVADKFDMIVSHHPLIFHGVKNIVKGDVLSDKIIDLIKGNVAVYSAHTTYDSAVGGVNDILASKLGLCNTKPLGNMGRIGELPNDMTAKRFCKSVSEALSGDYTCLYGDKNKRVRRIAVCGGAGSFLINDALAEKADLFVTGDLKHHEIIDAVDAEMALIDAGHYATEAPAMEDLAERLRELFPDVRVEFVPTYLIHETVTM
ncbi:MAG: Nif3-like dinuclear metal center hexameric protein [Abditibacteriota bacterium]|nr:Nif3-like dinuclear metal center hexameric protein [Abditibacteriota bacterium]